MDGSDIAQLTVPPGGTFRYEFPLLHAGTFWYHPHVRTNEQVEKGLYGALIVHDRDQDEALGLPVTDHVIMLDDILVDQSGDLVDAFTGDREDIALASLNGREGNITLANGRRDRFFSFERDVPQRIRFINVANARFMRVSVPEHPFWRIGGDQGLIEAPIEIPPAVAIPVGDAEESSWPLRIPADSTESRRAGRPPPFTPIPTRRLDSCSPRASVRRSSSSPPAMTR